MEELELMEREQGVTLAIKPEKRTIAATGGDAAAVDRALEWAADHRAEVVALLRQRQGIAEQMKVEREISLKEVPALIIQRANYRTWFMQKTGYFQPNDAELDKMFSVLEEGDQVIPDFAHSFSVRKRNGLVVSVDRKGRVTEPSPYSPAVKQ
ncbi:MAG TPA: hypothetical protein VJX68_06345 [Candidatus Binatus sp.]|uniref:hypothetical protein n=1 Tax=Candidatus Binatus sp. TaxID=2811406 RepID=UPI002B47E348|nr:hypothetical protein [Candidatus Binatus sp.]HKN12801.1 hypothetical protein [Candidatus Binatus sp.]